MSDKSGQSDPSMNEILGSIKRIITEDSGQAGAAPAAGGDDGEEILDLTDEVKEAEGDAAWQEPTLTAVPAEQSESEVRREPILGLHAPSPTATGAAQEPAEQPEQSQERPEETPVSAVQEPAAPAEVEQPTPIAAELAPAEPASSELVGAIVSETATAATASALGELTRAMDEKTNKLKVGSGDATISDIVKEMLRPMLREWLDENLPGIVERIVRREIQKLVDRAEGDD